MVFIAAVRGWDTVEALTVAVMLVVCTHQAMVAIISLVAVMLVEALTHHRCILVVAWVAVVTWVVEALDPTIEIVG
ncbi:hypothetical protein L6452_30147 [Arctium lappa]|uniref:Uncharacterized protein n=1 Tax=Arctium lappa TaxID=4217 RepID=A0ACB8ZIW6_ARCLA|nr:hypothetical protein L6452_30147 [Arctium lappa]